MMFAAVTLATANYATGLTPAQSADITYTFIRTHAWAFQFGFLLLGLGQALFAWLWWKSRLIPRPLAGLGIAASALMAAMALVVTVRPDVYSSIGMIYMAPMGAYEILLGLWLLIAGLRTPDAAQA